MRFNFIFTHCLNCITMNRLFQKPFYFTFVLYFHYTY